MSTKEYVPPFLVFLLLVHSDTKVIIIATAAMIDDCPAIHFFEGHWMHVSNCL